MLRIRQVSPTCSYETSYDFAVFSICKSLTWCQMMGDCYHIFETSVFRMISRKQLTYFLRVDKPSIMHLLVTFESGRVRDHGMWANDFLSVRLCTADWRQLTTENMFICKYFMRAHSSLNVEGRGFGMCACCEKLYNLIAKGASVDSWNWPRKFMSKRRWRVTRQF